MSKAFTKETDPPDDGDDDAPDELPQGQTNYMTPRGLEALRLEYKKLFHEERPKIVEIVSWAAGNGDRSENGDYIYGKKRLREIDRRVRYLMKRMDSAMVVDPQQQKHLNQIFFGAYVTYAREDGSEHKIQIVGVDEANLEEGRISWIAPLARALMKARVGDEIQLRTPGGTEKIEVISISYVGD